MRLRTVSLFTPRCDWLFFFFFSKKLKVVKILGAFFILAFSLKMVGKMLKFARKFVDLRVKQKILFEYGLQIWFFCNLTIGWLSKFPAAHLYPQKNLSTPRLASSFIHFSNKFNNINILFLHFFHSIKILSAFQGVTKKPNSSYVTKCFTQFNCDTFIQFHHQCTFSSMV